VLIDLKKMYDRELKEILKWALMRKRIPKTYINMVKDMNEGSYTCQRSVEK